MYKAKCFPFNKKQKKLAELTGRYYSVASDKLIDAIKIEIYHPKKNLKERKKAYQEFKGIILALKSIFKEIVRERNRVFGDDKCKNYFDFSINKNGIPKKKVNLFFNKADKIIKNINKNLPLPNNLPKWYWSEFNIPDSLYFFHETHKYAIPNDVYRLAKSAFPEIEKIIPRIKIEKIKDFNPRAKFIKETKSVIIEASTKPSIYNALTFVHELGHAISFIKLAEKGIDPLSKNKYWHEREAYKFKLQFEELCLKEEVKNASRGSILGDFLTTFFEYEIHNNPDQDFDKAYAKAINRCYPLANQERNPFYVLENGLIFRPCLGVITSVVWTALLSVTS